MLLITTKPRACRACTGVLGQGTVISWVVGEGPYHTRCSPLQEDANYKHVPMIPLDCAGQSLQETPPPPIRISFKQRVLVVISALWLLIAFLSALNTSDGNKAQLISGFSVLGLIPVGLIWGVIWINGARRRA